MNFPREFQFNHGSITYNAFLVERIASWWATGKCCICRRSLWRRPHYATRPALLYVHADCAQQQLRSDGSGTTRSLNFPSYHPYGQVPVYPHQQQQQVIHGFQPQHYQQPWPCYNNMTSSAVIGAIGPVVLKAFLQALIGSMLDGQ